MVLTDIHVHSTYSADGESSLGDMLAAAEAKGIKYLGMAEHFDYDYNAIGLKINGLPAFTDAEGYFAEGRKMQNSCKGLNLLLGCEMGYSPSAEVWRQYGEIAEKYSPDFIVNSVHTCAGHDCWFAEYFEGKDKFSAYKDYLLRVKESLSAPYNYDIVGHIGYVSRNAPYADPVLRYAEFSGIYDDILKEIIARGKILEVNSSVRTAGCPHLPDKDVLARYFELGGRKVSFSSDAHCTGNLLRGREEVVRSLVSVGFDCLTVPCRGREIKVPLV